MKRHLLKKSKRALRRRTIKNREFLQPTPRYRKNAITVHAPKNFSFIKFPEEYIEFLQRVYEATKKKDVFINVSKIEFLTTDAIYTLLCKIYDVEFNHNRNIQGNFPKNKDFAKIWIESGFPKYVGTRFSLPSNFGENIWNHWSQEVKAAYSDSLIRYATEAIFGTPKYCKGIQRTYVELMSNTVQHAAETGHNTWWTAVYCDRINKIAHYTFVDGGVGIFESSRMLTLKTAMQKASLLFKSNHDLLIDILGGKNLSSTGIPYRGQGLNSIGKVAKRDQLKNLILIANDVYANISTGTFKVLPTPYEGTFFYWEYDSNCK